MRLRLGAVPLATTIALGSISFLLGTLLSGPARAQAPDGGMRPPPFPRPPRRRAPATPAVAAPADAGAQGEADLAATRKAVQDLEAQVLEMRRLIDGMDRSRASVDDIRRRLDEMDARLGENDRRDDALAAGTGREATLFKFRDDGFAMRSPHGRFLLIPHLRLQTVYTGVLASQGSADATSPISRGSRCRTPS